MMLTRSTVITGVAVVVLLAATLSAIPETLRSGRLYLFSWEFLRDLPPRFIGTGSFRFIHSRSWLSSWVFEEAWPTPAQDARRT